MSHTCHAHGCTSKVLPRMFACKKHWYSLRLEMRNAIWREYREGQENTKTPSIRYLAVQQRAVAEIAFSENRKLTREVARYIWNSERFRQICIDKGLGDPLEFSNNELDRSIRIVEAKLGYKLGECA